MKKVFARWIRSAWIGGRVLWACLLWAQVGSVGAFERGAVHNVAEAKNYALVYSLNIPSAPNFAQNATYDMDLHAYVGDVTRVAYYLELQVYGGVTNYLWVSMDAFTHDLTKIGIPTVGSGAVFQQPVTNMNVYSSVSGIVTGDNLTTGTMEFWPSNFGPENATGAANASDTLFDWGDTRLTEGNYGTMQVHNPAASQVLFAFNRWGGLGGVADVGIGNGPSWGSPDWTFNQNATYYAIRMLQVYVLPVTNSAPPVLVGAEGQSGRTNVVLTFSKMLDRTSATNLANYAIDGGLSVLSATLDELTQLSVNLTTSTQAPLTHYTVTVNGVKDQTANQLEVAPNSTAVFRSTIAGRTAKVNVPEANDYTLIYSLYISDEPNYANGVGYIYDNRSAISGFSRVAYYLELQPTGGRMDYLWTSMDAFTNDVNRIGVPTATAGASFQQAVSNLTVFTSSTNLVTGTNMTGGWIEFLPSNYDPINSAGAPNASDEAFDWGDHPVPGSYGCMQVHNAGAKQVVFAFNNWGGLGGGADLGIGTAPSGSNPDWTFTKNASSYYTKVLQVWVLAVTNTNAPVLVSAVAQTNMTNVVLTFSKPMADDADDTNAYTLSGGLKVLSATLEVGAQTTVTLGTTPQRPFTEYTVTVNGVRELNGDKLPVPTNSSVTFRSSPARGYVDNVAEAQDYSLVYSLNIPNQPNYLERASYDIDLSSYIQGFSRVAYYLELQSSGGPLNFLWASMDAFTTDIKQVGVPTTGTGANFQQPVGNLTVLSSVASIVNGTNLWGGNIEFWPLNYDPLNSAGVPGASDVTFDWGDNIAAAGTYGSMQVHNAEASQVLFAFNRWGGYGGTADLGIGNGPTGANPDWTFSQNAGGYAVKRLDVLVLPDQPTNPPVVVSAKGRDGLTNVVLTFSKALADDATNIGCYAISGGLNVLGATLDPLNKLRVTLQTAAQTPATSYTITLNGLRDRTANQLPLAPNATAAFRSALAGRGATNNVSECTNYTLLYSLDIPDAPNYASTVAYTVDNRSQIDSFARVAYYLELQPAGDVLDYIWVSMDAFTDDIGRIGVPTTSSGATFQQAVSGMTVEASGASIVTGTNLTGWIEFWPSNYDPINAAGVANASDTSYDWGDHPFAGTYGSMQVHNPQARQVLFAFNRWGGFGGVADLGIGNNSATVYTDWTWAQNASTYSVKTLQVWVLAQARPRVLSSQRTPEGSFTVTFSSEAGRKYSLWRKRTLSASSWVHVGEVTATGDTTVMSDDQATSGLGFYRVSTP